MKGRCDECAYAEKTEDPKLLECRRYPPLASSASHDPGAFPCVDPEWTCGEFEQGAP